MSVSGSCCRLRPMTLPLRQASFTLPTTQSRFYKTFSTPQDRPRRKTVSSSESTNQELQRFHERKRERLAAARRLQEGRPSPDDPSPEALNASLNEKPPDQGDLASNSLLNRPMALDLAELTPTKLYGNVVPRTRLMALDPKPWRRRRWERAKLVKEIRHRGRVPKSIQLKRTERGLRVKSPFIRTSMKKLSPLAHQIAGKTIDEAILQMQYSNKRAALAVKEHLELARDQAIVERGMGLGAVDGTAGAATPIRLKDGKSHTIRDRTAIYVAQAWVGKGPYGQDANRRARRRIDRLRLPQTSLTVLLKEEATRVREHAEREARAARRKPWAQMPDRPLVGQQQHYAW